MPTPSRIRKYKNLGIKTIINLRGGRNGALLLENEACNKYNINLINLVARSRAAPDKKMINEINEIFNKIEYPALIHCKSGADRAGIVAALYQLLYCNEPIEIAKKQLSIKFLHIKWAKTGILDKFFDEYDDYNNQNNEIHFLTWVNKHYDPIKLENNFKSNRFFNLFLEKFLRRE